MAKIIKHTCANCEYYHPTLMDMDDKTDYHIHDYCSIWGTRIPDYILFDRNGYVEGYGDIECGVACCWCFEARKDGNYKTHFADMKDNKKE